MYACIYEHRKNWRGTGGRVDGKSKVLQEVLADLKRIRHQRQLWMCNTATAVGTEGVINGDAEKIKFLHNFSRQLYNWPCVEYFCTIVFYLHRIVSRFRSNLTSIILHQQLCFFSSLNWDSGSWMCSLHWFQEGFIQLIHLSSFSLKTKIKCRIHSKVCLGEDKNFPFFEIMF